VLLSIIVIFCPFSRSWRVMKLWVNAWSLLLWQVVHLHLFVTELIGFEWVVLLWIFRRRFLIFQGSCADSCPENGIYGDGELCCIPGFRHQGSLWVPDKQIDRIAQYLVSAPFCFVRMNIDLNLNITTLQYSICYVHEIYVMQVLRLVYQKLMFTCWWHAGRICTEQSVQIFGRLPL
jgi:hypothetical protein